MERGIILILLVLHPAENGEETFEEAVLKKVLTSVDQQLGLGLIAHDLLDQGFV